MLDSLRLPEGVSFVRTTREFTDTSLPDGLRAAHHIAAGVWGLLRVVEGNVTFVLEDRPEQRRVGAGESQVIEPSVGHHVEPDEGARFVIEFYRPEAAEAD